MRLAARHRRSFPGLPSGYRATMADNEKSLHKGDKVTWKSHGNEVHGTVEKEITERTEAAGRTVDASEDEPQYQVRSDKSGREAVHKPQALKRDG